MSQEAIHSEDASREAEGARDRSLSDYGPLVSLVLVAGLCAVAIAAGFGTLGMRALMHAYMGVLLSFFALLKLFDLRRFEEGFAMYDLLATRVGTYGLVYPFLELGLGLAYFAFVAPPVVYVATIALFGFGALGVVGALREGLDVDCPCMGSALSVPLSTVTLAEDLLMVAMAAVLLVT